MEEIVIPCWSLGSVLLFSSLLALLAAVVFALVESVRWLHDAVKRGLTATDALKIAVYLVLVAVSAFPGFVFHKMNYCWAVLLLGLPDNPGWDMLSAGMAVQKTVIAYTLRTVSIAIVYAISSIVIRKDRANH